MSAMSEVRARIAGFVDFSTIDWFGKLTTMVFLSGCNFRCPYCQNGPVALGEGEVVTMEFVEQRVRRSLGVAEALGVSGGEPTLQPKALREILAVGRRLGLKNFLETNASNPSVVLSLVDEGLLDYVALDAKAALTPKRYAEVAGISAKQAEDAISCLMELVKGLAERGVGFEVRTTIVPTLVDSREEVAEIARKLVELGCRRYVLMQFDPNGDLIDKRLKALKPPSRQDLIDLARAALEEGVSEVYVFTREEGLELVQR